MSINITPATLYGEVAQNLKTLFGTVKGSVPGDRDFGLTAIYLDSPMPVAMAMLSAEMVEAAAKYEPRANITDIKFSSSADALSGELIPVYKFELVEVIDG